MRLSITHRAEYRYDHAGQYALQRLRLVPISGPTQKVRSWTLAIEGAREEVRFADQYGNDTRLLSIGGDPHVVSIEAHGEVDTVNKAGVVGPHRGFAPLWLFERETPLTAPGEAARALAAAVQPGPDVARLHELMAAVHERVVAPAAGSSQSQAQEGTAQAQAHGPEEPPANGNDATVDNAHLFIAAARLLGFPSRFVSGYLMVDDLAEQSASHAWAEAHVRGLGWVGFDAVRKISPEENYVRVAVGRDFNDAMPISGIPLGQAAERLAVRITVEQ
jgi:transglutaminase-like putative cysteine protease